MLRDLRKGNREMKREIEVHIPSTRGDGDLCDHSGEWAYCKLALVDGRGVIRTWDSVGGLWTVNHGLTCKQVAFVREQAKAKA